MECRFTALRPLGAVECFIFGEVFNIARSLFGGGGGGGTTFTSSDPQLARDQFNFQVRVHKENQAMQDDFAKRGIRWRVSDAKQAGIHPLYALGAATPQFSPSSFVPGALPTEERSEGPGVFDRLMDAGQSVERALYSTMTNSERYNRQLMNLQVERGELENALLRSRIALLNQGQTGPASPEIRLPSAMDGVGAPPSAMTRIESAPLPPYEVKRTEIPSTQPSDPTAQAGAWPGIRYERTPTGWRPQHTRELIEDADITSPPYLEWLWHNRLLPSFGIGHRPPPDAWLPKNATGWLWSALNQEYQPSFARREDWLGWAERASPNWIPRRQ